MALLRKLWKVLQELSGESSYERYCAHLRAKHRECELPTEKDFYLSLLKDKYERPNRCC